MDVIAWTTPETFAHLEVVTATKLNTNVRDNFRELWHEVAYVEFTATVSSNTATFVDVVSAGAVTFAGFPIFIEFYAPGVSVANGGFCMLNEDGVDLKQIVWTDMKATGGKHLMTPTAASHIYKIRIAGTAGGSTSSASAAAGSHGFIRILEQGGP